MDEWLKSLDTMFKNWNLPKELKITTIQDNSERIKLDLHALIYK